MARAAQEGKVAGHVQLGVSERARRHTSRWRQWLAAFWVGGFGHFCITGFQPVLKSFKFSVEKPPVRLQHSKHPESLAGCRIFDVEIISRFVMTAPPLARNALRADRVRQAVQRAAAGRT